MRFPKVVTSILKPVGTALFRKLKPRALKLLNAEIEKVVNELMSEVSLTGPEKRIEAVKRVLANLKTLPGRSFNSLFPEPIPNFVINLLIESVVAAHKSQEKPETESSGSD
jgi:hypothetical protein